MYTDIFIFMYSNFIIHTSTAYLPFRPWPPAAGLDAISQLSHFPVPRFCITPLPPTIMELANGCLQVFVHTQRGLFH